MTETCALAFHLDVVPPRTNHHAKRIVRVGAWTQLADKPELVAAKELLDTLLLPHRPPEPVRGAVALLLEFTWPWLAADSLRTRARGRVPHTSKPDCSNIAKTLEDRLKILRFIEDDANVVDLHVRKWRGDRVGIDVTITPWTAGGRTVTYTGDEIWQALQVQPQDGAGH